MIARVREHTLNRMSANGREELACLLPLLYRSSLHQLKNGVLLCFADIDEHPSKALLRNLVEFAHRFSIDRLRRFVSLGQHVVYEVDDPGLSGSGATATAGDNA